METMQTITKVIAHAVRNEIEDFHAKYLTDDQMKELNPLIRTGIYNALFAIANSDTDSASKNFLGWHLRAIPEYWEEVALSQKQINFSSHFLTGTI
jgi:L-2-hydroxyglutarate oxidase LhgO